MLSEEEGEDSQIAGYDSLLDLLAKLCDSDLSTDSITVVADAFHCLHDCLTIADSRTRPAGALDVVAEAWLLLYVHKDAFAACEKLRALAHEWSALIDDTGNSPCGP